MKNMLLKIFNHLLQQVQTGKYIETRISLEPLADIDKKQTGSSWDSYISAIMNELKEAPATFLRMPVISRTMHPNEQKLASAYLDEMGQDEFSRTRILPTLHDIPIGNPYLCAKFPMASPLSIQHGYYRMLMHKYMHIDLQDNHIAHVVEFGGGYGNFCRLAYSSGYAGKYVIIDFPEMHILQKHYLSYAIPNDVTSSVTFATESDLSSLHTQCSILLQHSV